MNLEIKKTEYFKNIYPLSFKLVRLVNRKSRSIYYHIEDLLIDANQKDNVRNKVFKKFIGKKEVGFYNDYARISISDINELSTYTWSDEEIIG